jgi:chromosome segregation protein
MRLKSIKLSGFKSFVDPTMIKFPSNMCAVVGPNGCGKSNVIDAVRWVMGESSAKYLRGESMTDVIFKGSKQRKPANQTSVELLFDNQEKKLAGEYSAYDEISIKRTLTTDAKNSYFLNGTKCRRKDIMDIFLGTGLGPRSYAIISQGMISNLIESKPEELRAFIEEAAGISKYKERRRETANRIRRTTENLERLADLRQELERQLNNLFNQAQTAEKYKTLKNNQRLKKADLQALKWQQINGDSQSQHLAISKLEENLEQVNARSQSISGSIETDRNLQQELSVVYQQQQDLFYQMCSSIATLEQKITHRDSRLRELSSELDQIASNWDNAKQQLNTDNLELEQLIQQEQQLLPDCEMHQQVYEQAKATLEQLEAQQNKFHIKWEAFHQQLSAQQIVELEQAKVEHSEQILSRLHQRKQKITQELSVINCKDTQELDSIEYKLTEVELQLDNISDEYNQTNENLQQQRNDINQIAEQLVTLNSALSKKQGKLASLEALQQSSIAEDSAVSSWITANKLDSCSKLVDEISIENGWELALEAILGNDLQAICVNFTPEVINAITELQQGVVTMVAADSSCAIDNNSLKLTLLISRITQGKELASSLLTNVYSVDCLSEALTVRNNLQANEVIVTKEGVIVAKNWVKVRKAFVDGGSVLSRKLELEQLEEQIAIDQEVIDEAREQQLNMQQQLLDYESLREQQQVQRDEIQQQKLDLVTQIEHLTAKGKTAQDLYNRLNTDLAEINSQYEQEKEIINESREKLQHGLDNMETSQQHKLELQQEKDQLTNKLLEARSSYDASKEESHKNELQLQLINSKISALRTAITRISKQATDLRIKKEAIQKSLLQTHDPDNNSQEELELMLARKITEEQKMHEVKQQLEQVETKINADNQLIEEARNSAELIRGQLEQLRVQHRELYVRAKAIEDQLREDGFNLQAVCNNLKENDTVDECEQQLQQITEKLDKLGLVNLAAIDEYEVQSKRKQHLDSQNDDLQAALDILDSVIKRIDKETKQRFRATFDQINYGLGYLFPKVFAGGQAYLQLSEDDLLTSGVTIMAQPPGKKNSTIHLLSGGEKALTAIALVFAIFQLNPSPFCMLDEVDAPLDDSNVGRYANMVAEMSKQVQFIYITHNKIAMQQANELIGVTMYEPGVSRPVAVNIEQATVMAEV